MQFKLNWNRMHLACIEKNSFLLSLYFFYRKFEKYRIMDAKIKYLSEFILPERLEVMCNKLDLRTRYLTVVLENIYQPQNTSAVLRTCEAFGVQDIHVIENGNNYRVDPGVALGTQKWLNIYKNRGTSPVVESIKNLKKNGYRIVATAPDDGGVTLEDFDIEKGKFALLFGTELTGLSEKAMNLADESLYIPMVGFVESFNISVSAAIVLHHLTGKLRKSTVDWSLQKNEKEEILFEWLMRSIRSSDLIMQRFIENSI